MKIRYLLKEYFTYSSSEKKGIFILLILVFLLFLFPYFFNGGSNEIFDHNQPKQRELDSILADMLSKKESHKPKLAKAQLFNFNPNTVSQVQLCSLGFTDFQSKNIIKYRSKGGVFTTKDDLLRIYGVSEKDLSRYDSYIKYPTVKKQIKNVVAKPRKEIFPFNPNVISIKKWEELGVSSWIAKRIKKYLASGAKFASASDLKKIYGFDTLLLKELDPYVVIENNERVNKEPQLLLVDLNQADSVALKQLPGIGIVLSKRIVKYRKLLGGFSSKQQLVEVYGLSKQTFHRISDRLIVDSAMIQKLEINSINMDDLRKHPYVDYRTAKDIVRYRDRNGTFSNLVQLKEYRLIPDSTFLKLRPYLNLN